jgi:hypothetical protein
LGGASSAIQVTVTEQAQRILTADRADGVSTFRVNQGGNQTMVMVIQQDGGETTITPNSRWTGQNQGAERGNVRVRIWPDGSY